MRHGRLTFKLGLDFGAIMGGATDGLVKLCAALGQIPLGVCFSELLKSSVLVLQLIKSCSELMLLYKM